MKNDHLQSFCNWRNTATYILLLDYSVFFFLHEDLCQSPPNPWSFYVVSCPLFEFCIQTGPSNQNPLLMYLTASMLFSQKHASSIKVGFGIGTEAAVLFQTYLIILFLEPCFKHKQIHVVKIILVGL